MDVLASAAAVIIEPEVRSQERRTEIEDRLAPLIADGGPVVALQPIVDLATGARVGAEALSRFPADWGMAPDVVFAEAHSVGLGHRLELLALERAAAHLDAVGGYVAMNVSPATLLTPECGELLAGCRWTGCCSSCPSTTRSRTTPRSPPPWRPSGPSGLRLAIDDVGAGLLLAAAHRRHLPRRHQDRPQHRRGARHRPGADQAGAVAGRVRARLRRPRGRRGHRDRGRGGGPARPRGRLRPGLALRPPRPAGGAVRCPGAARRPDPDPRRATPCRPAERCKESDLGMARPVAGRQFIHCPTRHIARRSPMSAHSPGSERTRRPWRAPAGPARL